MDKISKLEKLELEMTQDQNLLLRESNLIFGEGDPNCEVLFIGEAPGANEDREKRPFCWPAGQALA